MRGAVIIRSIVLAALLGALAAPAARAACMNKFVFRQEGMKLQVTLLTGKLTFQEAKELAAAINNRKAAPIDWLDVKGKSLAHSTGDVAAVRPMPVGCDDKASGSVLTAMFLRSTPPSGTMTVKFSDQLTVIFDEQKH